MFSGKKGGLVDKAVFRAVLAAVRCGLRVEYSFTSLIHVFPRAMRKEERAFFAAVELFTGKIVSGFNVDEVLYNGDGVADVHTREFIDVEFFYQAFGHGTDFFMQAAFLRVFSDIRE